jgi:hypothetical protein
MLGETTDGVNRLYYAHPVHIQAFLSSNVVSHGTADDDGEKMRIATPHLLSSNFSTRTTTPAIARVIGLPGWKSLVKYTFTPGA